MHSLHIHHNILAVALLAVHLLVVPGPWSKLHNDLGITPLVGSGAVVEAAHPARTRTSSRGPSSSNDGGGDQKYDRSISIFSDSGRLLQVEYGISASNRGGTVACLQFDYDVEDVDEDDDEGSTSRSSSGTMKTGGSRLDGAVSTSSVVCVAVATRSGVGAGNDEVSDKVHRVDDHCLLITTGLSGDGRALAQATRIACQRMRLSNGEPPTLSEIALTVADMQHELTRTSGGRPFGTTATIVGVDPAPPSWSDDDEGEGEEERVPGEFGTDGRALMTSPSANGSSSSRRRTPTSPWGTGARRRRARAFQSEPGGTVEEHTYCSAGRGRDVVAAALGDLRSRLLKPPLEGEPYSNATASDVDAASNATKVTTSTNTTAPTTNSDDNSTAAEESAPVLTLEDRIAVGVARSVFDSDKDAESVDVWWIEPCPSSGRIRRRLIPRRRRGAVWIRCARAVGRDDVESSLRGVFSSSPPSKASS